MTQTSVRWANVVFGVGLTVAVALAPMIFVVLSGVSAEAGGSRDSSKGSSVSLLTGGIELPHSQALLILVAGMAVAVLALAIALTNRSHHKSP